MRRFSLVVISAFLSVCAFYRCEFLIFLGIVPFLFVIFKTDSRKKRFLSGYVWGAVYFAGLCYWLIHISLLGMIILIMYLALYPAVFAVLCRFKSEHSNIYYVSGLWVTLEFLRSVLFTGFPWGHLGYVLFKKTALIQIADIAGVYGVSFVIILANCVIFYIFTKHSFRKKVLHFLVLTIILISSFIYGSNRLKTLVPEDVIADVALIQTNVNSHFKWDESFYQDNLEHFKLLSLIAKYKNAEFIISPESIFPYSWGRDRNVEQHVESIMAEIKIPLLLGIPFYENSKIYNSALFLDENGKVNGVYFKMHLVPFGEYIPCKKVFSFLDSFYPIGSYSRGENFKLFNYKKHPFSVLICYEDIFPYIFRRAVISGANFLINQSDEGWFKASSEAYLHNQITVFRAIENRRSLLRATNTGITCLIDYKGNIVEQMEQFKADVLICNVPVYTGFSFYSKYGWLLIWVLLAGVGFYLFKAGIRCSF